MHDDGSRVQREWQVARRAAVQERHDARQHQAVHRKRQHAVPEVGNGRVGIMPTWASREVGHGGVRVQRQALRVGGYASGVPRLREAAVQVVPVRGCYQA